MLDIPWIGGIPPSLILDPIAMPCDMETIPIKVEIGREWDTAMMDEVCEMGTIST